MTSRFLWIGGTGRVDVVGARAISRYGRVCPLLLLAGPRRRARGRRHVRGASTRSVVVPAAVPATIETTAVHRAVDGFSCEGCKVRARTRFEGERSCSETSRGVVIGCTVGPMQHNVGHCSLVYAELIEVEQSSIPMSWLGNSTLDSPAETSPIILPCIGCTGFTGRGWSLDPFYLPTGGRARYWFKKRG